jgi:hypothetical protein
VVDAARDTPHKGAQMNVQEEIDSLFVRNILCAMIETAVDDVVNETAYTSKNRRNTQHLDRQSAIEFIRSKAFVEICDTLNLPADKIKRAAFQ